MSMKIEWADYLVKSDAYKKLTEDEIYIEAWQQYIERSQQLMNQGEINIFAGDLTIKDRNMILEYVVVNLTDRPIQYLELAVSLSIQHQEYFKGVLKTANGCYQPIEPNGVRIDLVDFGNDRFRNQVLKYKDYDLVIHSCKEIEYLEKEDESEKVEA